MFVSRFNHASRFNALVTVTSMFFLFLIWRILLLAYRYKPAVAMDVWCGKAYRAG